jgi:hypothetical protein
MSVIENIHRRCLDLAREFLELMPGRLPLFFRVFVIRTANA